MTTPGALVSARWVAERIDDPRLVLVEVDEEAATHHWSHVPGATFIDYQDTRRSLLAQGPEGTAAFEALMSLRGLHPDDDVVLYGDGDNRFASAVLWLMRQHGHRSLRLMSGGRAAWLAEGLPMTDEETVRPATAYRARAGDPTVRATRDDLLRQLAEPRPDDLVVDCRTGKEFDGRVCGPRGLGDLSLERGHVPGAVNIAAEDLLTPGGGLLAAEPLAQLFAERGVRPEHRVTAYCHTSDRSCLVWFALREVLGFPCVRVYDGGWQEYGHLVGAPVVREHGEAGTLL